MSISQLASLGLFSEKLGKRFLNDENTSMQLVQDSPREQDMTHHLTSQGHRRRRVFSVYIERTHPIEEGVSDFTKSNLGPWVRGVCARNSFELAKLRRLLVALFAGR